MNSIKQFLNSKLNLVRFSAQVLVVGTILSVTFFLLVIDSFKEYRSEIMILVNVKTQISQEKIEQISDNIIKLPQTLSFYDRLLKYNPDVRDVFVGMTPDQRKKGWNEMFSIAPVEQEALVFKLAINTKREADAEQLVKKSTRTLFDTVAFYYDIKDEVDLRIIDGPISKTQVPGMFWLLILSVIGGFALAVSLNFFFLIGKKRITEGSDLFKKSSFFDFKKESKIPAEQEIESLRNLYETEQLKTPFVFEEKNEEFVLPDEAVETNPDSESTFQEMKKITKELEPGRYPNYPEMPVKEKQQASAPDNLPIAEDTFFAEYEAPEQIVEEKSAPVIEEELIIETKKEPTPEELKKRLNQLLRGEL